MNDEITLIACLRTKDKSKTLKEYLELLKRGRIKDWNLAERIRHRACIFQPTSGGCDFNNFAK